jgi:putative heme-binding domain-containing protein
MPYLGSSLVDEEGVRLLADWIGEMTPRPPTDPAESEMVAKQRAELAVAMDHLRSVTNAPEREAAVDRLLGSVSGALTLLYLMDDPAVNSSAQAIAVARATMHSDPTVRDLFARFVPDEKRDKTLGLQIKPGAILAMKGDAQSGRRLFFAPGGAQCHTCHRVQGEGRDFGPDLSHIGTKYDRAQILESVLEPSKSIDPAFAGYTVETREGAAFSGLLGKTNAATFALRTLNPGEVQIAITDIVRLEKNQVSLMPEQLLQSLTAQEAADLLEFLQSLR